MKKDCMNDPMPVRQMTKDGELVKVWPSQAEAARHGFKQHKISQCITGTRKSHYGYRWEDASKKTGSPQIIKFR